MQDPLAVPDGELLTHSPHARRFRPLIPDRPPRVCSTFGELRARPIETSGAKSVRASPTPPTDERSTMSADPLAAFRAADPPYQHALEELRALEDTRDQALLEARLGGLD